MSHPRCWDCGRKLVYVGGIPIFATYVDPIGVEHKMHKDCLKRQKAEREDEQRAAFVERHGHGS